LEWAWRLLQRLRKLLPFLRRSPPLALIRVEHQNRASPRPKTSIARKSRRSTTAIGVALIGVITVASVDAFIGVTITTDVLKKGIIGPLLRHLAEAAERACPSSTPLARLGKGGRPAGNHRVNQDAILGVYRSTSIALGITPTNAQ
jgi:hypothetical protein